MTQQENQPDWLHPKPANPLTGAETFLRSTTSVSDFWRWGFSDLRENITRGILAEFLVAKAVGDSSPLRHAWDNFDVTTPSGTRIEVKSSAYLQSWRQSRLSTITFSGLTGREYIEETNEMSEDRRLRADVYIFAVHTCRDPDQYHVLDLDAWQFFVAPVQLLRQNGAPRSISMGFLKRAGVRAVPFEGLREAIDNAAG